MYIAYLGAIHKRRIHYLHPEPYSIRVLVPHSTDQVGKFFAELLQINLGKKLAIFGSDVQFYLVRLNR